MWSSSSAPYGSHSLHRLSHFAGEEESEHVRDLPRWLLWRAGRTCPAACGSPALTGTPSQEDRLAQRHSFLGTATSDDGRMKEGEGLTPT